MTKEEAITKAESGWWKTATAQEIVELQLYEDRLCMPFAEFHKAVEVVLGRCVWTHEFANKKALQAEHTKQKPAPSMAEIFGMFPQGKEIIAVVED